MQAAPCGIHGSAGRRSREYEPNAFKNRSQAPRVINPRITLEKPARGAGYNNNEADISYASKNQSNRRRNRFASALPGINDLLWRKLPFRSPH
jgi:hypothetical protein